MTGPACGNNPHYRLSDGDRQAVDSFRAYLTARAALQRIRTVLETEHVAGRTALEYRGLITAALMADETAATETQPPATPVVCEGFVWIGQSFATCDRCGQPAWEHDGQDVAVEGAGPFDPRRTVRPWEPGQADAIRAKWEQPTAGARQGGADHTCNSIVARGEMDEPLGYLICGYCGTPKNGARS
ncbi:hypothetical protein ACP4B2_27660 [Streptomyces rochei]|uniref:hypothetical protein n=1 Tax=Streptomyces rochei TaxID=1928 RepID=UPI003D2A378C